MAKQEYELWYQTPAPAVDDCAPWMLEKRGWERYSLPLGNGKFGANVFGRLETERIQITQITLANPYMRTPQTIPEVHGNAGVDNFAELFIDVNHSTAQNYRRSLNLNRGLSEVSYTYRGVRYKRTAFCSNVDNVLVVRFEANKKGSISLCVRPQIPFVRDYMVTPNDRGGKTGEIISQDDLIVMRGEMQFFGVQYEGQLKVRNEGGKLVPSKYGRVWVEDADAVTLLFACGTNYQLDSKIFLEEEPDKKLAGYPHPHEKVENTLNEAQKYTYQELLARHEADFSSVFNRVEFSLEKPSKLPTDVLLKQYRAGKQSSYLETLLFHYGRYLLISCSRGFLPANLQGIWNCYYNSPWSVGFWHNINLQMNYWLSGPANLRDLFVPYINYAKAYMPCAQKNADTFVRLNFPDRMGKEGDNGWTLGTGCNAYQIEGMAKIGHSGPGTGAFTSLLFWDYYDYTQDEEFLREFGYPALRGMSLFFTRILEEIDGKMLVRTSASPEQEHNGSYYHSTGCAFDQQMIYENDKRTLQAAEILHIEEPLLDEIRRRMPLLDPVLIGDSGQVKEFREETVYGSIGEYHHRHVSNLVGLYPGTFINATTPEWLDAASVTLTERGDKSTGWATAHRLLLWARVKNSKKFGDLMHSFMNNNVMENLWDSHPPFQIDGNFGFTAGVCEALAQSHAGFIEFLPALPQSWQKSGAFHGLVARGAYILSCQWKNGNVVQAGVRAEKTGEVRIKVPQTAQLDKPFTREEEIVTVRLQAGETVKITY